MKTTLVTLSNKIQSKLNKILKKKTSENRASLTIFVHFDGFSQFLQLWLNCSTPTCQSGLQFSLLDFWHPWHPWGGWQYWIETNVGNLDHCVTEPSLTRDYCKTSSKDTEKKEIHKESNFRAMLIRIEMASKKYCGMSVAVLYYVLLLCSWYCYTALHCTA